MRQSDKDSQQEKPYDPNLEQKAKGKQTGIDIQFDEHMFDRYKLAEKLINRGATSQLYQVFLDQIPQQNKKQRYVVKLFIKPPPTCLKREIMVLQKLKGLNNISHLLNVGLYKSHRQYLNERYALLFPYYEGCDIRQYTNISFEQIRNYMRSLLQALKNVHQRNIFHGDVKPSNIVFNRKSQTIHLLDWGCGQIYQQNQKYTQFKGTPAFQAPELLLGGCYYNCSIDIWSAGVIFAGLIFNKDKFFGTLSRQSSAILQKVLQFTGTQQAIQYIQKNSIKLKKQSVIKLIYNNKMIQKKSLAAMAYAHNTINKQKPIQSEQAIDLIQKMLIFDPDNRTSEALKHKFFTEQKPKKQ